MTGMKMKNTKNYLTNSHLYGKMPQISLLSGTKLPLVAESE
jgi:hypothetical protein